MTKSLAVDSNNDLYLDNNGNIAIVTGLTAVMQSCQQAAQTLLGEMVLQTNQGIPYFQVVFTGVPNVAQFEAALRTAFLAVPGVTQVASIDIIQTGDPDSAEPFNALSYTATIDTIYGQGTLPFTQGSPDTTELTSLGLAALEYDFRDENGVIVPTTGAVLADVIQEYKDIFGEDLNPALNTPQGLLITAETLARTTVLANNCQIANQINPNFAGGIFLDAIGRLTDFLRKPAEFTLVAADLTGEPGTTISAFSQAKESVTGNVFELVSTVTLDGSGQGSGVFRAVNSGPIMVPPGTLTQIVSGGVLGWETVNNPNEQSSVGTAEQSDEEYRNERNLTLASQGITLSEAIISGVRQVNGVASVLFRQNNTNSNMVIDGVTLVPHSIYVCVDGGIDADIANVIQEKTMGLAFNGSTTVNITDEFSGQIIPVKFDKPTEVPILVRATAKQNQNTQDIETAIRDAIDNYANGKLTLEQGLTVGQTVSPFELAGAVNREYPQIYIGKMEISLTGSINYTTNEIPIGINQKATIAKQDITVIVTP